MGAASQQLVHSSLQGKEHLTQEGHTMGEPIGQGHTNDIGISGSIKKVVNSVGQHMVLDNSSVPADRLHSMVPIHVQEGGTTLSNTFAVLANLNEGYDTTDLVKNPKGLVRSISVEN